MIWRVATVLSVFAESATARTLVLWIPGWPGHVAGQHVDLKLTAEDGYTAVRSYSIASAPSGSFDRPGETIEVTVEQIDAGEVSPYLVHNLAEGDQLEVRGPIGGWFVWRPAQTEPIQLIAGGSGIAPLMSMVRAGVAAGAGAGEGRRPMRLLYSTRSPDTLLYGDELTRLATERRLELTVVFTRIAPEGWTRQPRRIDVDLLPAVTWLGDPPTCYVCGPSPFVETAVRLLQAARHPEKSIRTERFGPV